MNASRLLIVPLLACALLSTSCDPKRPTRKRFATCAPLEADQPTIVVLSRPASMMAPADGRPEGPEDRLVFAAWPDCAVVFREGTTLRIGHVPAETIDQLLTAINDAGFFDPPLPDGMLFPDGPVQILGVRDGAKQRTLKHYGPSDDFLRESIARNAGPSKEKEEAFVAMWDKIIAAMTAAHPVAATPYEGGRYLPLRH